MDFRLLMEELKLLSLPSDQFTIITSGALAARGIREANDFDLVTTEKLWSQLVKKYKTEKTSHRYKISISQNIEILGPSFNPEDDIFDNNSLILASENIDGVNFANLKDIRKMKHRMGRPKDIEDIKLIDAYIEKYST